MTIRRRSARPTAARELTPGTAPWILRLLVPLGGHKELVGGATLARIAQADLLAPAVVDRVASVVRSIRFGFDADGAARAVATTIPAGQQIFLA